MFNSVIRKRKLTVVFSFYVGLFLLVQANSSHAKDLRVGYVDIQLAVANTKEWKKEFVSFKTKFQREKISITKKEEQLKKKIADLNKQSMVLNPELKKKIEDDILKKKREFERYVQDKNEEFAKKEKEITNEILKKMVTVIKNIGKEKRFTIILEKKLGLYFDESLDLTTLATLTYDKTK